MPSSSRARRRSDNVRGLMPAHECSSSEKRRGPSERSWTRSAVHFAPMISAQAATEQLSSWMALIVRIAPLILLLGLLVFVDRLELVADSVARLDERVPWRVAVDLVAQPPHEDVDGPVAMRLAPAPDPLQQLVASR